MKKGVKMMDMSIHDVSGVVGWCLGAYSEVENTYVHHHDGGRHTTQLVLYAKRSALSKRTRTLGHYHTEPY